MSVNGDAWLHGRDFLLGVNLPWLNYGGDFGANAWRPGGGLSSGDTHARLRDVLGEIAKSGARAVRWFLLCDGRAGVRFDAAGRPTGLDGHVFRDLDTALALLKQFDLAAMFVLFDYRWCTPAQVASGVQMGGHAHSISSRGVTERLLDAVVSPLLDRYGAEPTIFAWDIINEPEWVTTRRPIFRKGRVRARRMRGFIRGAARRIHSATHQLATVGSLGPRSLRLVAGLGLDFYQVHWYEQFGARFPLDVPVARYRPDRPLILGEFPTKNCSLSPDRILDAAARSGYRGAFAWSVVRRDEVSDRDRCAASLKRWSARIAESYTCSS